MIIGLQFWFAPLQALALVVSPRLGLWQYDYAFFWIDIITTCVVVIDVHCTIFVQVGLTMIMSIKVHKPSLVIKIFIQCLVWEGNRWETSFWTCVPLFKAIVATLSQSVLWVVVCSLPQGHWNKWVPRSSMIWSHLHHERWAIERCGKPRQICNVVRKWAKDIWKKSVVGRANI